MPIKKIVVLGGGFAGVTCILTLLKKLKREEAEITLIDYNNYQVFNPSLYEVATNEEPRKNTIIPYNAIFPDRLNIICAQIKNIDIKNQTVVTTKVDPVKWDYLIVSLGSESNYFFIHGLERYAYSLKNLQNAIAIRNKLKDLISQSDKNKKQINIFVAGGGFSGTELTAEIANLKERVNSRNPDAKKLINISVIESKDRLLNGLDEKVSSFAQKRLESFGVNLLFNCQIKNVSQTKIETEDKKEFPFDILIWTGGIRGNSLLNKVGLPLSSSGLVKVNNYLQSQSHNNVFAAGDCAQFLDPKTNCPVAQTGQIAKDQGRTAAKNVYALISGKNLHEFKMKNYSYLIPLKGRWVLADLKFMKVTGFLGWILQQIVFLRYLLMILPLKKAFKKWNRFEMQLRQS